MSDEATTVVADEAPVAVKPAKAKRTAKKAATKKSVKKVVKKAKAAANGKPAKKAKREGLSQFGAALKVLAGRSKPMTVGEIMEAITSKGLWSSPGGATPNATLSAALQRDVGKGKDARIKKVGPGQFLLKK